MEQLEAYPVEVHWLNMFTHFLIIKIISVAGPFFASFAEHGNTWSSAT